MQGLRFEPHTSCFSIYKNAWVLVVRLVDKKNKQLNRTMCTFKAAQDWDVCGCIWNQ